MISLKRSLEECNASLDGTVLNTCGLPAERFYLLVGGGWDGRVFGRCAGHPLPAEWLADGFLEVSYGEAAVREVHGS